MGFIRALDTILPLLAVGRKQLRDLIDAARPSLASRAGGVIDGLANLEPVIAQIVPLSCPADPAVCRRRRNWITTDFQYSILPWSRVVGHHPRIVCQPRNFFTYRFTSTSHNHAA